MVRNKMKIYSDKLLSKEIDVIDFGIVLAGDTKEVKVYVYNDADCEISNLEIITSNNSVFVGNYSKDMKAYQSQEVTFSWKSSDKEKKGLKSELSFKFFEIYS